jgi:transglutaminase/protease-like cytokinesis protein 3
MRVLATVLLMLLMHLSFGQEQQVNLTAPQQLFRPEDAPTPELLAYSLTARSTTELDKVSAIFNWIADNIAYGVKRYPTARGYAATRQQKTNAYDSLVATRSLNEIVAYDVMKKRTAVCNGYTRLFKTLCDYAGLQSEIITGYARTNMGSGKFRSNHTWNAVRIDSVWHLLDVTWASGYITFANEFVKHYDGFYFLTPPDQFIRNHYPEDLSWALLDNPPTLREFQQAPFRHSAFVKYKIDTYKPAGGVVEAAVGDTVQFELETTDAEKETNIASEGFYDSTTLALAPASWAFIQPTATISGKKIVYTYPVQNSDVQWLHIVYNNDVILRYKLSVKKEVAENKPLAFTYNPPQ